MKFMKYCHEGEEANKLLREAAKAAAKASAPKIMKNCTSLEVHEVRQANKSLRETAKAAAKASAPKSKYSHCQEYVLRRLRRQR